MTKEQIKNIVEKHTKLKITNPTRKRQYVEARSIYYKLLREYTRLTLSEIGKYVKKHHATVLHGINALDFLSKKDVILKNKYLNIKAGLDILQENLELENVTVEAERAEDKSVIIKYMKLKNKHTTVVKVNTELINELNILTERYDKRERHFRTNGYIIPFANNENTK
jgi:hypothetical protein